MGGTLYGEWNSAPNHNISLSAQDDTLLLRDDSGLIK